MRTDFRNFRLGRMDALEMLSDPVSTDPAHGLRAYLAAMGEDPDLEL
jgi:predicted DNA-binding transcriptional regulator YafY